MRRRKFSYSLFCSWTYTGNIIFFKANFKVDHELPEFEHTEVFVDSPLAVEATNIFMTNTQECFDEEAMALVRQGINPIRFRDLDCLSA